MTNETPIDLYTAESLLDALCSNQDPIYYKGRETSVNSLLCSLNNKLAGRIRIQYYIGGGKLKKGTVLSMLKDRLKDYYI